MSVIVAMLKVDLKRFTRDRFIFIMTLVSLSVYTVGGQFIPDDIAPEWRIAAVGASATRLQTTMQKRLEASGDEMPVPLEVVRFETEAEMKQAFVDGEMSLRVGIALDDDAMDQIARGEKPQARVYVDESSPPVAQDTARAMGALLALALIAPEGAEKAPTTLLGPKVEPVSFGRRTRTLMAFMILILEMIALASLVAKEISGGVVHAVLTTTVSLPRYFLGKVLFGVLLSFSQAAFLATVLGVMSISPVVIGTLLLLGATLFTAFGIIAGTRGKHLMEVMMWSFVFILPCIIPSVASMLPGTAPLAVAVLPTYPIVQGLLAAGQTSPLVPSWVHIGWAAGWTIAALTLAYAALRRRVK